MGEDQVGGGAGAVDDQQLPILLPVVQDDLDDGAEGGQANATADEAQAIE